MEERKSKLARPLVQRGTVGSARANWQNGSARPQLRTPDFRYLRPAFESDCSIGVPKGLRHERSLHTHLSAIEVYIQSPDAGCTSRTL